MASLLARASDAEKAEFAALRASLDSFEITSEEFEQRGRELAGKMAASMLKKKEAAKKPPAPVLPPFDFAFEPLERHCAACGATAATLLRCSRCKRIKYCGASCQRNAWTLHKLSCSGGTTAKEEGRGEAVPNRVVAVLREFGTVPGVLEAAASYVTEAAQPAPHLVLLVRAGCIAALADAFGARARAATLSSSGAECVITALAPFFDAAQTEHAEQQTQELAATQLDNSGLVRLLVKEATADGGGRRLFSDADGIGTAASPPLTDGGSVEREGLASRMPAEGGPLFCGSGAQSRSTSCLLSGNQHHAALPYSHGSPQRASGSERQSTRHPCVAGSIQVAPPETT